MTGPPHLDPRSLPDLWVAILLVIVSRVFESVTTWLTLLISVAVLRGDSKVAGTVTFEQASESTPTTVSWNVSGHDANAERGFHIHQFGDNTNGCTSAGPHFNPFGKTHGAPEDEVRHVGDLGNFKTDAEGNAVGSKQDKLVKLIGAESILGVRDSSPPVAIYDVLTRDSVPLLFTPVLTTSAVAATRSRRRPATLVLAPLAVSIHTQGGKFKRRC